MWNSITGRLTYKGAETACVQDGGLEWEVHTSSRTLDALPEVGNEARLFTHLHHRDDQMRLYGFATRAERNLFLDLLRVGGVGPRLVQRILSGIDAADLVRALETSDLQRLVQIPGLGTKTAQKMVLTLQGQLTFAEPAAAAGAAAGGESSLEADITAALVNMGFGQREAREAANAAAQQGRDQGITGEELEQTVLRLAVTRLSALTSERSAAPSGPVKGNGRG